MKTNTEICKHLLIKIFLDKNLSAAIKTYFNAIPDSSEKNVQARFYKSILSLSQDVYDEMVNYGNDHLVSNRTFMDAIAVVILSSCSGIGIGKLSSLLEKSRSKHGYLNAITSNYNVILKYVNLSLSEHADGYDTVASLLKAA